MTAPEPTRPADEHIDAVARVVHRDRCTAAAKASNARYQQRKTAKRRMERATA